jgi:MHS family proline/betaine transporter-like MFS transporter
MQKISSRINFLTACLGNLFQHYDAALFGFLSPFLAPLIFPEKEPITALILTYAMIPLGMLARPLGSLFFGYIGDVYGRSKALFLALAGMALISGGIAFSPTYSQAGILAPVIFCIGRILQNFFSSGETMGGAIFLLENSSEKKHDLLSSFYSASTIAGILLASAGISLLSHYQKVDSLWRLLYLFGCIMTLFGCMMRRRTFEGATKKPLPFTNKLNDLGKIFWTYKKPLLSIMVVSGFSYATYSIALVLMNGFVPLVSTLTKSQMMSLNTSLLFLDLCALPFFGWLSSKISREKLMLSSSLGAALSAIPLFMLIQEGTLMSVLIARVCLVLFGVAFSAPFHAWAQTLIPPAHRYAVISFGYALGSQVLGGPSAAISLWLFKQTNWIMSVSWYWIILALTSSVVIFALWKKKNLPLHSTS